MVRQDIVAALKNALERGERIDFARRSLINAGYSLSEVQEAESYLTGGAVIPQQPVYDSGNSTSNSQSENIQEDSSNQETNSNYKPLPHSPQIKPKNNAALAGMILLIILLLLLLGGVILGFIFRDSLFSFLESLAN
jgi:hypothetical protein